MERVLSAPEPQTISGRKGGVEMTTDTNGQSAEPSVGITDSERAELERLRKEVPRLRMEAEFAKKVAAWFAKDQP